MWTRKELKTKAKAALRGNYWKTVLIALVFTLVCSGAASVGASVGAGNGTSDSSDEIISINYDDDGYEDMFEEFDEVDRTDPDNPPLDEMTGALGAQEEGMVIDEDAGTSMTFDIPGDLPLSEIFAITGVLFAVFAVVAALALAVEAFIANPVEVGAARFFTQNLNQPAEVKELAHGFDHNYRETVKTMFFRDIRIILWGLMFIVPGIVKAYEYRMIPYLLADDPTMTKDQAFAQSKAMMSGNKGRAFMLDLSFIGWYLLALPTLGLVTIFYASPYKHMTDAALYEELRYGQGTPQDGPALPAPTLDATPSPAVPVPPFAAADAPAPAWDDEPAEADAAAEATAEADSAAPGNAPADGPVVPDDPQA